MRRLRQVFGLSGVEIASAITLYWSRFPGCSCNPSAIATVVPDYRCGAVPALGSSPAPDSLLSPLVTADTAGRREDRWERWECQCTNDLGTNDLGMNDPGMTTVYWVVTRGCSLDHCTALTGALLAVAEAAALREAVS